MFPMANGLKQILRDLRSQKLRTFLTVCGIVFLVFRYELIGLFVAGKDLAAEQAEEIIAVGGKLMICAAVFQTADAFGIAYTGALRGAGDTVWPGMVTIVYSWVFIVAAAWSIAVLWPGLESVGPWIAAAAFVILYGLTMWWRFETGRWRSISLLEPRSEAPKGDPAPPPGAHDAVG